MSPCAGRRSALDSAHDTHTPDPTRFLIFPPRRPARGPGLFVFNPIKTLT